MDICIWKLFAALGVQITSNQEYLRLYCSWPFIEARNYRPNNNDYCLGRDLLSPETRIYEIQIWIGNFNSYNTTSFCCQRFSSPSLNNAWPRITKEAAIQFLGKIHTKTFVLLLLSDHKRHWIGYSSTQFTLVLLLPARYHVSFLSAYIPWFQPLRLVRPFHNTNWKLICCDL